MFDEEKPNKSKKSKTRTKEIENRNTKKNYEKW